MLAPAIVAAGATAKAMFDSRELSDAVAGGMRQALGGTLAAGLVEALGRKVGEVVEKAVPKEVDVTADLAAALRDRDKGGRG